MKFLALLFSLCLISGWCAAQSDTLSAPVTDVTKEQPVYLKNSIKVNLSSLALNNVNLSYERSLTPHVSVMVSYRFMPETNLYNLSLVRNLAERYSNEQIIENEFKKAFTSGNALTAEVRLYGGQHPGARGFYVSAYGRYTRMESDYLDQYQSVANKTYQIPYQVDLRGVGGGLMFGAQWLIAKRVTLDWYIIGAHYGKMNGDIDSDLDLSSMSDAEQAGLKEDLEHFVRYNEDQILDATVTDEGVSSKANGPFVGLRGLGINLGIAF